MSTNNYDEEALMNDFLEDLLYWNKKFMEEAALLKDPTIRQIAADIVVEVGYIITENAERLMEHTKKKYQKETRDEEFKNIMKQLEKNE